MSQTVLQLLLQKKSLIFFFLASLPFLLISWTLFLKDPLVWPDEALFFDTARHWAITGQLGSGLLAGAIPGYENHAYWTPPLYIYLLGVWTSLFGDNIEASRSLTVVLAYLSLGLVFFIAKRLFQSNFLASLGVLLVSLDYWFSHDSRVTRMDMLSFFFLLCVLLLLLLFQKGKQSWYLWVAGLISSLGILTHPLGLIPLVLTSIFIYLDRSTVVEKVRNWLIFLIPNILVTLLWLWSMKDAWNIFILQYQLQLARKAWQTPFAVGLFQENLSWKIIFILEALLVGLYTAWIIKKPERNHIWILLSAIVAIVMLTWGKEAWYILYLQPFITLIALSLLKETWRLSSSLFMAVSLIAFILLSTQVVLHLQIYGETGGESYRYHQFVSLLKEKLPNKGSIFLSSAPDPYFDLRGNPKLRLYEFSPVPLEDEVYKKFLDLSDYAVVTMTTSPFLADYLRRYHDPGQSITVSQYGGYSAQVIKLIPREKRI